MNQESKYPQIGTVLWAMDVELSRDVFRGGAATKPNTEFLRFADLGIDEREGRIPDEELELFMVTEGKGISLHLERMVPAGYQLVDSTQWKQLDKRSQRKAIWWSIEQGLPIPSGLKLEYDGQPPGHCTLTVTRDMTVKTFLSLVSLITFVPRGTDLYGLI